MMKPTIHLNGTSAESLAEGYMKAHGALERALQALQGCWPNGRDYYTQGPTALLQAEQEFQAVIDGVNRASAHIMLLWSHVEDAKGGAS